MSLRRWSQCACRSGNERNFHTLLLPRRFFFLFSLHWKGKRREADFRASPGMGSLAALRTFLVLGLVTGLAGCAPGLNGTADRWEALYSRSLARIPGEKREEISRDGDYLLGIKRLRRLYCNVGIGFHIQVLPDGRITGVHNENRYSKLSIISELLRLYACDDLSQFVWFSYNLNIINNKRTFSFKVKEFLFLTRFGESPSIR